MGELFFLILGEVQLHNIPSFLKINHFYITYGSIYTRVECSDMEFRDEEFKNKPSEQGTTKTNKKSEVLFQMRLMLPSNTESYCLNWPVVQCLSGRLHFCVLKKAQIHWQNLPLSIRFWCFCCWVFAYVFLAASSIQQVWQEVGESERKKENRVLGNSLNLNHTDMWGWSNGQHKVKWIIKGPRADTSLQAPLNTYEGELLHSLSPKERQRVCILERTGQMNTA